MYACFNINNYDSCSYVPINCKITNSSLCLLFASAVADLGFSKGVLQKKSTYIKLKKKFFFGKDFKPHAN